jgi:FMN phosphatase YigB (HAD superfamily)
MSIVDPSTVLFIDDRQTNLETAHQLGLQTLLSPDDEQAIVALLEEKIK